MQATELSRIHQGVRLVRPLARARAPVLETRHLLRLQRRVKGKLAVVILRRVHVGSVLGVPNRRQKRLVCDVPQAHLLVVWNPLGLLLHAKLGLLWKQLRIGGVGVGKPQEDRLALRRGGPGLVNLQVVLHPEAVRHRDHAAGAHGRSVRNPGRIPKRRVRGAGEIPLHGFQRLALAAELDGLNAKTNELDRKEKQLEELLQVEY